ncbi:hypothetical protein GQR58_011846 [Nymphon striatum]|nr:hypothetical protein GQR58_011846 [Nymphon striatum]
MNDLFKQGYAEPVPVDELNGEDNTVWYLPHHPVIQIQKGGKVRIVFDCAAKYKGESLNNNVLQGPDLTNKLLGVLLRFRKNSIGIMADIKSMFHQLLQFCAPQILKEKNVLHPDTELAVVNVWERFSELYFTLTSCFRNQNDVTKKDLFTMAREWVELFLTLAGKRKGFEIQLVTPYIHILVFHVTNLTMLHFGIKQFSAQGMEKLNDVVKCIHKQHSNRIEACASVIQTTWRQNHLSDQKRVPRVYAKWKLEYWDKVIFEKRKREIVESENTENEPTVSVDLMNVDELKAKLKELGVQTKLRSRQKLRNLLLSKM